MLRHGRALAMLGAVVALLAVSSVAAFASSGSKHARVGDDFFKPGHLVIRKGTKVSWKWTGSLSHNVTVRKGPVKFHSRTQAGGSFSHRFRKRGTYFLYCTLHPTLMKEKIVVR
ncbi:MAG TPA: plastocyanin/azurin family copper-binding protein [Solirubrobacteraceae bacterium]|jgi:plastocyanin